MKSLAPLFHTFSVSTVDIEQVNEYWVRKQTWQNTTFYYNRLTRVKFTFANAQVYSQQHVNSYFCHFVIKFDDHVELKIQSPWTNQIYYVTCMKKYLHRNIKFFQYFKWTTQFFLSVLIKPPIAEEEQNFYGKCRFCFRHSCQ